jgi:hypothetical protein
LRSLRLREWRSSSLADESIRRSNAWPAISRAFAALLGGTLACCAFGDAVFAHSADPAIAPLRV